MDSFPGSVSNSPVPWFLALHSECKGLGFSMTLNAAGTVISQTQLREMGSPFHWYL